MCWPWSWTSPSTTTTAGRGGILWQAGTTRPYPASSINYVPGRVVTNSVTTKVGATGGSAAGKVSFFTWEATDMLIDVVGYYRTAPAGGGGYVPLTQTRILDTAGAKIPANSSIDRKLRGVAGIPDSTAVTAVVFNATVHGASGPGPLTVWPKGLAKPDTSVMNYSPVTARTEMVTATLSADGWASIWTWASIDLIIDVAGYYTTGSNSTFVPLTPKRIVDTRYNGTRYNNNPNWGIGPVTQYLAPNTTTAIKVTGTGGVPETGVSPVSTVILNVVADAATTATSSQIGFLTVWASGDAQPGVLTMSYYGAESASNLVMAKVGADGKINIHNYYAATELIIDVVGYFTTGTGPGAPTNVMAAPANQGATLAWGPPVSDGGTAIAGYLVKVYKTTPTLTYVSETTTCATCTSAAISGLTNGQSYRFDVFARNSLGYGAAATTNDVTPGGAPDLLAPTSVVATRGDGSATLTWAAPVTHLLFPVSYTIYAYRASDNVQLPGPTAVGATSDATVNAAVTGLTNGVPVYFRVTATSLVFLTSPPSAPSNTVTPAGAPMVPDEVYADPGDHQATVHWRPAADNGSPITGYRIEVFANGQSVRVVPAPLNARSITIGDLANGTAEYRFEVRAVTEVGPGVAGSSNTVVPAGRPFEPQFVLASVINASEMSVSWVAPLVRSDGTPGDNGNDIRWYTVVPSPPCGNCTGLRVPADDLAAARTTVRGLSPATEYRFRVLATNVHGTSDPSSLSDPRTTRAENPPPRPLYPTAPTNVEADFGDGQAVVSWTASDPQGSAIIDYTITAYRGDGSPATEVVVPGTQTVTTITGLSNVATYIFWVQARNAVGTSTTASTSPSSRPDQLRGEADSYMTLPFPEFLAVKAQEPGPFDWTDNGCSAVGFVVPEELNIACARHDFGYRNYGNGMRLAFDEGTRHWIDRILLNDVQYTCGQIRSGAELELCRNVTAYIIYDGVRAFGGFFYG